MCLEYKPHYRKALGNQGLAYQAIGDNTNAAKSYEQAIALERSETGAKHGEAFGYYGAMLIDLSQLEKARQVLLEGAMLSPKSMIVNFELGRVLSGLNQFEQGEHYLLIAEELAPKYSKTHYLLGRLYFRQKQGQKAS